MAAPYFYNPFAYPILVPTPSGAGIELYPGKFVQGTYFSWLVDENKLALYDGVPPTEDIVFVYPESGNSLNEPSTITDVIAGTGLAGGGNAGAVTVSIANGGVGNTQLSSTAVTANKVPVGQLVKSINTLTDDVVLAEGANVTITPSGNSLVIAAPNGGLATTGATLPLVLTLTGDNSNLNGSIAITVTDDGGAVAKQTGTPDPQTGSAYLQDGFIFLDSVGSGTGLFGINTFTGDLYQQAYLTAKNTVAVDAFLKFFDDDDNELFAVDSLGNITGGSYTTPSGIVTIGTTTSTVLTPTTSTFNGDVHFNKTITFGALNTVLGSYVAESGSDSAIFLSGDNDTVSMLKFKATDSAAVFMEAFDSSDNSLIKMDSTGNITAKSLISKSFVLSSEILTAGAYTVAARDNSAFACDCTLGTVSFTLPTLDQNFPSGTLYMFIKTDGSVNNVLVSPANGQTINGVSSKIISSQYRPIQIMAFTSVSTNYWLIVSEATGVAGTSGYSGFSGNNPGTSGYSGATGASGTSGYSGYSGDSGISGYSGLDGV